MLPTGGRCKNACYRGSLFLLVGSLQLWFKRAAAGELASAAAEGAAAAAAAAAAGTAAYVFFDISSWECRVFTNAHVLPRVPAGLVAEDDVHLAGGAEGEPDRAVLGDGDVLLDLCRRAPSRF